MISKSGLCCYGIILTLYGPWLMLPLMYMFGCVFGNVCSPVNPSAFTRPYGDRQVLAAFRHAVGCSAVGGSRTEHASCTQSILYLCCLSTAYGERAPHRHSRYFANHTNPSAVHHYTQVLLVHVSILFYICKFK